MEDSLQIPCTHSQCHTNIQKVKITFSGKAISWNIPGI